MMLAAGTGIRGISSSSSGADATQRPPVDPSCEVYRPTHFTLSLDHSTANRMKYSKVTPEQLHGSVYCSELKNLMNDISFLTEKASAGDTVVYIGNTIGSWIQMVTSMFPTLQFVVYDGNPTKVQLQMAAENANCRTGDRAASNTMFNHTWFSAAEADRFICTKFPSYDPSRTLVIAETRNIMQLASCPEDDDDDGPAEVFHSSHVLKDMADQEMWMHALQCPRSALMRFTLPYVDGKNYSYMKGEMRLQPFAARTSAEVRLSVDYDGSNSGGEARACGSSSSARVYPKKVYDSEAHDECMFYHNTVTRTQHVHSASRVKVKDPAHKKCLHACYGAVLSAACQMVNQLVV
jgi:hypothetical protein